MDRHEPGRAAVSGRGRLVALGTGDAFSSAGRGHTCWLLEDEAGVALIDCGASALPGLWRAGVDPHRVRAVHLTHLHGDHFVGLPFLLLDALYRGPREGPLLVSGPPGTQARLRALYAACYPDTARKLLPFALEVRELAAGETAQLAGRTVSALFAQHQKPPHVALSLRVEGPSGLLAFTGDTGPHAGLADLARGARLLIAECTDLHVPEHLRGAPAQERKHLAWDDLRALLPALGAPRTLLAHLGAEAREAAARIEADAAQLGLEVTVCDDGQAFAL